MPVFNNALAGAAGQTSGGDAAFKIERSLRFNSSDSPSLIRQVTTKGSTTKFTWAGWIKRGKLSSGAQNIFSGSTGTDTGAYFCFPDNSSNALGTADALCFKSDVGAGGGSVETQALFRDPGAWYSVVLAVDTTQATASNRVKIWVNGVSQSLSITSSPGYPNQDAELSINDVGYAAIGAEANGSASASSARFFGDFYLADVHFLDGIAVSNPYGFGEFSADTGVWNPIQYTGNYNGPGTGTMWSGMLTSSSGFYSSSYTAEKAFDGNINTNAWNVNNYDNYMEFTPTTPINFTNGVQVYCYAANGYSITNYYSVDLDGNGLGSETTFVGGGTNFNGMAWISVATGSGTLHKLRIRLTRTGSGSGVQIGAFDFTGTGSISNSLVDGTPAGSNGYHLDFSDSSSSANLGNDANGNNNFTVNNISASAFGWASTTWSNDISIDSGNYYRNNLDGPNGFDGTTNTYIDCRLGSGSNNTTNIIWEPTGGISGVTKIRVHSAYADDYRINNGTWTSFTSGGNYTEIYNSSAFTLTKLEVRRTSNSGTDYGHRVTSYEINDIEVRDNTAQSSGGEAIDSLLDSPTNYDDGTNIGGNYCVLNQLAKRSNHILSNGNLTSGTSSGTGACLGTIAFPNTGKWYYEAVFSSTPGYNHIGIATANADSIVNTAHPGYDTTNEFTYWQTGSKTNNVGYGASFTGGDVIGVAFDADLGSLTFYKNGVSQGVNTTGLTGTYFPFIPGYSEFTTDVNFGQRPWVYPVSGYKALCTQNFDNPTITKPSEHFDVVEYNGSGQAQTISGLDLQPDIAWIKEKNGTSWHRIIDSVRGQKELFPNDDNTEVNFSQGVNSFTSDGFTLGTGSDSNVNTSSKTYVGWLWKAATSFSNSAGSNGATIASSGKVNQTAGISIVTYSYTGTSQQSYVHGLNKKPDLVLRKARNLTESWSVYHSSMGFDERSNLDNTNASSGTTTFRSDQGDPTSTLNYINNNNTSNVLEYVFTAVPGFSAFGKYEGTGTSEGMFQWCGFQPRWILLKNADNGSNRQWLIIDTKRTTFNKNGGEAVLFANSGEIESYANDNYGRFDTKDAVDILSNGFRPKEPNTSGVWTQINNTQQTHIWAAFADFPFKYARAF